MNMNYIRNLQEPAQHMQSDDLRELVGIRVTNPSSFAWGSPGFSTDGPTCWTYQDNRSPQPCALCPTELGQPCSGKSTTIENGEHLLMSTFPEPGPTLSISHTSLHWFLTTTLQANHSY